MGSLFYDLIQLGHTQSVSDLHLSAGHYPAWRIDGDLCLIEQKNKLSSEIIENMLFPFLSSQQLQSFSQGHDIDFSFSLTELPIRFRCNLFKNMNGTSAVLRYVPKNIPTLESLKTPAVFKDIIREPNGLVLITGPTGSGKSTTLAAMIHEINIHQPYHIVTIEDPIEFIHTSKKAVVSQREIHTHVSDFHTALRSSLREDPNIILVGELRDAETIRLALTAAETGHLVLSTLHTSSAVGTINRIIDVFSGNEKAMVRSMLSESLNSVIAQTLIKQPQGGRRAIHEIMRCTPAIRHLIREDKISQIYSVMQTSAHLGMMTKQQGMLF